MTKGRKNVLVTGVSSGIGWGIAKVLGERGFHVYGSVRKQADGDRLKAELGDAFTPLLFDVTDAEAVSAAAAQLGGALDGDPLCGLVNNAGIMIVGPLKYLSMDNLRRQLEVNLVGTMQVTQAFLPLLQPGPGRQDAPGRIVMISSVGGKIAAPFLGAYSASKFGIEAIADTLRRELMMAGVDVIIVEPGPIRSSIFDKMDDMDISPYAHTEYAQPLETFRRGFGIIGRGGLPPEAVGELLHKILTVKAPKARYPIVKNQFFNFTLPQWLPARTVDKTVSRRFGLETKSSV